MSAALIEQRDRLAARLEDGDRRIRQAETAGTDVTAWEGFWITLLQDYEAVCRELAALDAISLQAPPPAHNEQQAPLMRVGVAW